MQSLIIEAKTKLSVISRMVAISANGSGIAEGRDLKYKSFNLAQMPNTSTKD